MKKIFFIVIMMALSISTLCTSVSSLIVSTPYRIAVLEYTSEFDFIKKVNEYLDQISVNNKNVTYSFFDANKNKQKQLTQFNQVIEDGYNLILLNLVVPEECSSYIETAKQYNIPVIFFNREPKNLNCIASYGKSVFIGTDGCADGKLQARLIHDLWNEGKIKDNNKNGVLDYILLKGESGNLEAEGRSKCVVEYLNSSGIKVNLLNSIYGNWDKNLTFEILQPQLLKYGNSVDLILSNNDAMAIGALQSLQSYGFNGNDPLKYVAIFGLDGIEEAIRLIKEGKMTGTLYQNAKLTAETLYTVGLNLLEGRPTLENTNFNFDNSGVAIRIPINEYYIN